MTAARGGAPARISFAAVKARWIVIAFAYSPELREEVNALAQGMSEVYEDKATP